MRTIITHFYNEEYILPWWLNHHKKYFDYGILIDYGSTDRSTEIIKSICPHWQVFPSNFRDFDAHHCDYEIMWYERQVTDWRIAVPVTEFLVGDIRNMTPTIPERTQYIIPTVVFADFDLDRELIPNVPLWEQSHMGIHYRNVPNQSWACRSLHNYNDIFYPLGRHFKNENTDKLMIFKYNNLIVGEKMLERKLQIQYKISDFDKNVAFHGAHHCYFTGGGLRKDNIHNYYKEVIGTTYDCTDIINSMLQYDK